MIGELIPTGVTFGVGRNSINDAFSGTAEFNNIALDFGADFSGGTGGGVIYSAGTDLYNIFATSGSDTNFSNTDLTFTGNRFHNLSGNSLLIADANPFPNSSFLSLYDGVGTNIGYGSLNSIFFNTDSTIDIYYQGQNSLSFTSAHTIFNDAGVDIDFRVKGVASPYLIYADAATGNVGIGKIPSSFSLDVSGDTNVSGAIYSGGTDLYNIFLTTADGNDITRVQPGTNISTGGTANNPIVNLDNNISVNSITSTTIINTYLDNWYTRDNLGTLSIDNSQRRLLKSNGIDAAFDWQGGILTGQTNIESSVISGGTIYSGGTNLETIIENIATGSTPISVNYWNSGTTGTNSIRVANGGTTNATGNYAVATGFDTTASGAQSFSKGFSTIASGQYSTAKGNNTTATGSSASAEGYITFAYGQNSHVEGENSVTIGVGSHAEGSFTSAFGNYSHAEGASTTAVGAQSHAEGQDSIASGSPSHAEGYQTTAIGNQSHSEGALTTAQGDSSHAEGDGTIAIGYGSHAEGNVTKAIGSSSHSEGQSTTAVGNYSHAGGSFSIASGGTSFIHSTNSLVAGDRSVVLGGQNITGSTADTVYVPNLNINSTPSNDNALTQLLARDSDGTIKYRDSSSISGGGVSIDPYLNLGTTGTTITWNVSGLSTNYEVTLSAATTLNLTNVRNGEYGTIIVNQDVVGGRAITLGTVNGAGTTHRVAGGGAGSIVLTSNANAIDILTFTYNGSAMYWTVGNDYT